jgi:phage terminase small subunit
VRAGYSPKTAGSIASENLKKPDIAAAIQAALEARAERTAITADRVLAEVALLAFSDLRHYVLTDDGQVRLAAGAPADAMRALQSMKRKVRTYGTGEKAVTEREVEIRLWEKPGPLKLAGQHVGLFKDRVEHSGSITLEQALAASREASDA